MPYVKPGIYTQEVDLSHNIPDIEPLPELILNVVKTRVEAKTRKLKARWSLELKKDLEALHHSDLWKSVKAVCPSCGMNTAEDCGYSTYDPYNGEHDCNAPDVDGEPCEYCHHLHCSPCKKIREAYTFKEEEFNV